MENENDLSHENQTAVQNGQEQNVKVDGLQQLSEFAKNSVDQVAKNEGFTDYTMEITAGSNHGDGFIGAIFKITIIGTRMVNNQIKNDKLVLIAKIPPDNEQRKVFAEHPFRREIFVYNNVLPAFVKFQKDKGIKESEGFFSFPKCYLAQYDEELNDAIIIMEDIRERNFKMENKAKPVVYENVRMLVEKLGQLHAISFAMKHQRPDEFEQFRRLRDVMYEGTSIDLMKPMIIMSVDRAITILEPQDDIARKKLTKFGDNYMEELMKCTNGELAEPYSVINHGDCWINNMMFKHERGNPKQICLLDWQITRYASPVLDLLYFIFACTNKSLRDKYFDSLIQHYYKSLREHLERLGTDPNKAFPYTALLRQLKLFGRFGLAMALVIVPMICTENENVLNFDEMVNKVKDLGDAAEMTEVYTITKKSDQLYRERIGGVIRDQVKLGYI